MVLELTAETAHGRRNRIGTVLVRRVDGDERPSHPPSRPRSSNRRNVPMPEQSGRCMPAEDAKLVTLARSARARLGAAEGAAVRDEMGRTYVAATWSCHRCS